jgi:uncharacterized OB-fold protein
MSQKELIEIPGEWNIRYQYAAGEITSQFFIALRDQRKIMATKCDKCGMVMLPPRSYCERCFVPVSQLVNVADEGTLTCFSIIYEPFPGLPKPPYVIGYVKLDGADTSMINFVHGADLSRINTALETLKVGSRVKVVYKEEREGRVTDFSYQLVT